MDLENLSSEDHEAYGAMMHRGKVEAAPRLETPHLDELIFNLLARADEIEGFADDRDACNMVSGRDTYSANLMRQAAQMLKIDTLPEWQSTVDK